MTVYSALKILRIVDTYLPEYTEWRPKNRPRHTPHRSNLSHIQSYFTSLYKTVHAWYLRAHHDNKKLQYVRSTGKRIST